MKFFNQSAREICDELFHQPLAKGEPVSEFRQRTSRGMLSKDILPEVRHTGQAVKSFSRVVNKQGTSIYLEMEFIPIQFRPKGKLFVMTLISDFTHQKVFEHKLINQTTYIADLFQKSNAVIFGVDMRGYITDWNEQATKVIGYEKNDVYARKATSILFDEPFQQQFEWYMEAVHSKESAGNLELPVKSRFGDRIMLLMSGAPRRSTEGAAVGITFVGQDITELTEYRKSLETKVEERTKELQRALTKEQEAVEIKSRFVSIASHEFRTPLSSIQFTSAFLRKNIAQLAPEQVFAKLDDVDKHVQHMTSLLDDVLSYGKSDQAKIRLMLSPVKLDDFLRKICEDVTVSTGSSHQIIMELPEQPVEWLTDMKMMKGIVTNLLTNAIKFSPGRDKVHLKANNENEQLTISIADDGIGIPNDELEKVFEPFTRGSGAVAIAGTGLGLSIVRKSVELLQGTLNVESELGKGTTFAVKIPLNLPRL